MNTELFKALVCQGHTSIEAKEIIDEMIERVLDGENPEEILEEHGLEPDYIFDILPL